MIPLQLEGFNRGISEKSLDIYMLWVTLVDHLSPQQTYNFTKTTEKNPRE